MTTVIEQMLKKYDSKNMYDQKNAMKEVMQEIVLFSEAIFVFIAKFMLLGGQFDHWAFIFVQEGEWQKKKWEPSLYSPI